MSLVYRDAGELSAPTISWLLGVLALKVTPWMYPTVGRLLEINRIRTDG